MATQKKFSCSLIILAGGKGSRMGDINKGLMKYNNKMMIDLILEQVSSLFDDIIIVTNTCLNEYQKRSQVQVMTDEHKGYHGPLEGIYTGLKQTKNHYAWVLPCDAPGPLQPIFNLLKEYVDSSNNLFIPFDGERVQPLFSILHKNMMPSLEADLQKKHYAVTPLFLEQKHKIIKMPQLITSFRNFNTPDDVVMTDSMIESYENIS